MPNPKNLARPRKQRRKLSTQDAAVRLNRQIQTLHLWSSQGGPIKPSKEDGCLWWDAQDVEDLLVSMPHRFRKDHEALSARLQFVTDAVNAMNRAETAATISQSPELKLHLDELLMAGHSFGNSVDSASRQPRKLP